MISTEQINQLVEDEYKRASEKFGKKFNSSHEAYAVILEEFEEASHESDMFEKGIGQYWNNVKSNDSIQKVWLVVTQDCAKKAIAEWIQVAAMCHKASLTLQGNE